jgi:hypothetical protein
MLRAAPFNRIDASVLLIVGSAIAASVPATARTTTSSMNEKPSWRECNRVPLIRWFDIEPRLQQH